LKVEVAARREQRKTRLPVAATEDNQKQHFGRPNRQVDKF
jgi:hypothetical protein